MEVTESQKEWIEKIIKEKHLVDIHIWRSKAVQKIWWFAKSTLTNLYHYDYIYPNQISDHSSSSKNNILYSQLITLNAYYIELDPVTFKPLTGVKEMASEKMNFHRFQYTEGGHSKFWEIWQANNVSFTTHWGKIGTKGQTKTKNFSSEYWMKEAFNKLIKGKKNKGYILVKDAEKIKMPKLPPKEEDQKPKAADLGLADQLDMLDL